MIESIQDGPSERLLQPELSKNGNDSKTEPLRKPLCIDLFAGLGGWAEGFLAEGYDVIGFDIERHRYPRVIAREAGPVKRPGMSWSGSDKPGYKAKAFNSASNLVLSEDDRQYWDSLRRWKDDKEAGIKGPRPKRPEASNLEWDEYPGQLVLQDVLTLDGRQFRNAAVIVASPPCQAYSYRAMPWKRAKALPPPDNTLFEACFRIAQEAGVPLIVENVCGAQKWVGRARWNFGPYYLWGNVPALMPIRLFKEAQKGRPKRKDGTVMSRTFCRNGGGKGAALRQAAQIAKIPFPLAQHIARVFKP